MGQGAQERNARGTIKADEQASGIGLEKILAGSKNVRFSDLAALVEALGFSLARTHGSHHIFQHPLVSEAINLQSVNGQAKPYQVRQVIALIEEYGLTLSQGVVEVEEQVEEQ